MSDFECLKLNINYRGDVSFTDQGFDYSGGVEAKDMVMDPDLMTWSIFDDSCKENGVNGEVESIWYKLPEEEIYSARVIGADKDGGIRELCREAMIGGEVDIYIVNAVSVPAAFPLPNDVVEDEELGVEDDDAEDIIDEEPAAETNECPERVQANGEDPVEERRHDDPRFEAFFDEIHNGTEAADDVVDDAAAEDINTVPEETVAEEVEDEDEFERQCYDVERPDHAMDTDDEWDAYDQAERSSSRQKFSKDKPPYIWMLQTFNSG
uniref:Uncharacterized protein At2g15800 n=2 Tax=Arabidopsis thaliana TaxID=3702 RepID=Q9XIL3_ARATH|nr:hypothetical protein [Arabidopsis thaliana]